MVKLASFFHHDSSTATQQQQQQHLHTFPQSAYHPHHHPTTAMAGPGASSPQEEEEEELMGQGVLIHGAARSGKSSLAFQSAIEAARQGKRSVIFCEKQSLHHKMPKPQCEISELSEELLQNIQFLYVNSLNEVRAHCADLFGTMRAFAQHAYQQQQQQQQSVIMTAATSFANRDGIVGATSMGAMSGQSPQTQFSNNNNNTYAATTTTTSTATQQGTSSFTFPSVIILDDDGIEGAHDRDAYTKTLAVLQHTVEWINHCCNPPNSASSATGAINNQTNNNTNNASARGSATGGTAIGTASTTAAFQEFVDVVLRGSCSDCFYIVVTNRLHQGMQHNCLLNNSVDGSSIGNNPNFVDKDGNCLIAPPPSPFDDCFGGDGDDDNAQRQQQRGHHHQAPPILPPFAATVLRYPFSRLPIRIETSTTCDGDGGGASQSSNRNFHLSTQQRLLRHEEQVYEMRIEAFVVADSSGNILHGQQQGQQQQDHAIGSMAVPKLRCYSVNYRFLPDRVELIRHNGQLLLPRQ